MGQKGAEVEGLYGEVEGLYRAAFGASVLFAAEWRKNAPIIGLPRRKFSKKRKTEGENSARTGTYTGLRKVGSRLEGLSPFYQFRNTGCAKCWRLAARAYFGPALMEGAGLLH
jgi:hypothetical protein